MASYAVNMNKTIDLGEKLSEVSCLTCGENKINAQIPDIWQLTSEE